MQVFEVVVALLLGGAALAALARRIGAPYPALVALRADGTIGDAAFQRLSRSSTGPSWAGRKFSRRSSPRAGRRNYRDKEQGMKKLLSPGVVSLVVVAATLSGSTLSRSEDRDMNQRMRDRFIGAWRLAWLEEADADGKVHRADCTGMLVFTREGRMSVQVMYRHPQAGTSSGPVQYAQGGYEASFGRYEIDERAHQFTYHVEGALVRSLIGKDLTRLFELSGKQLIVKPSSPNEHWRVAWEHY